MRQLFGPVLGDDELAPLEVIKQIASSQVLHDNVDVVLVFKQVEEPDDVRVLTHFEDFNLTALQLDVLHGHFFLAHDLDGHLLAGFLVNTCLDQTELAFAECLLDFVEVEQT